MALLHGKVYNIDDNSLPTPIQFYLTSDVTLGSPPNPPSTPPDPNKVKASGQVQTDNSYAVTITAEAYHAWLPSLFGGRWAERATPPAPHPPHTVLVTEPVTEYNWRAPGSKPPQEV